MALCQIRENDRRNSYPQKQIFAKFLEKTPVCNLVIEV